MLDQWFLMPALALLVGACALVPLGQQVMQRGVVFMDLAVAQAAAAASLWALVALHRHDDGLEVWLDLAGLLGSLACATAVAWLSQRWPQRREALIGLLYVLCACLALLGARMDPHGRDRLLELLAADVLWVQAPQLGLLTIATALLWAALQWRPHLLEQDTPFYFTFALIISAAVPVLGLFLVFALLIGPALWQRSSRMDAASCASPETDGATATRHSERRRWLVPLAVAWTACIMGLAASWWWDAPSGACIALACALAGLGAVLVRR